MPNEEHVHAVERHDAAPGPAARPVPLADLRAQARHAHQRAALYRRKVLTGRGDPRRLAELERISAGAAGRARTATVPPPTD